MSSNPRSCSIFREQAGPTLSSELNKSAPRQTSYAENNSMRKLLCSKYPAELEARHGSTWPVGGQAELAKQRTVPTFGRIKEGRAVPAVQKTERGSEGKRDELTGPLTSRQARRLSAIGNRRRAGQVGRRQSRSGPRKSHKRAASAAARVWEGGGVCKRGGRVHTSRTPAGFLFVVGEDKCGGLGRCHGRRGNGEIRRGENLHRGSERGDVAC